MLMLQNNTCVRFFVSFLMIMQFAIFQSCKPGAPDKNAENPGSPQIYQVTADSLIVRSAPSAKSKALYTLPKGAYFISNPFENKKLPDETIYNIKGRWVSVDSFYDAGKSYVFGGLVKRADDYVRIISTEGCTPEKNSIICKNRNTPRQALLFSDSTPVAGCWVRDICKGPKSKTVCTYEKTSAKVQAHVKKDGLEGDFQAIVQQKGPEYHVLQFFSLMPGPRGCE
jgi:hypothetical protein